MAPTLTEGKLIPFTVGSETYQTWYTTTISPSPTPGSRRPLVLLHGGPGCTHHYHLSFLPLADSHQVPLVFYDQIGNGLSTHLPEAPSSFWNPDLFMDELENVLKHLGIENDYDLLGHSWGGMLAVQFAAERQPKGLKHLVISNSPASMALWEKAANVQRSELPVEIQELMTKHEEAGTTESAEYHEATMAFYKKHTCRLETWPEELNATFGWLAKDPTVYGTMNGPSEFTIVGSLKSWNIIPKLSLIPPTLPTLLLNGRYDSANSEAVMPFFKGIPRAKWVTFEASSHMPQWEEQEHYNKIVGEFLTEV